MYHYNKLIRDKIPQSMEQRGKKIVFHQATTPEEAWYHLIKKLQEEIDEFSRSRSINQYVDILDVMAEIETFLKFQVSDLRARRENKNIEQGGFKKHWVLQESQEKIGDDFIDYV